jgi:hypothetical protein
MQLAKKTSEVQVGARKIFELESELAFFRIDRSMGSEQLLSVR